MTDINASDRTPRILLVDDENQFAEMVSKVLQLNGYDVQVALFGEFALAAMEIADFDLVITDINMPGMDGIELIQEIRRLKPDQPVIVVTGYPSKKTKGKAFRLGTLEYMTKPFPMNTLLEVIGKFMAPRPKTDKGLVGSVKITCEELIQLYALGRRTASLEIHSSDGVGYIHFDNGLPVHAEIKELKNPPRHMILGYNLGKIKGEEAFFRIQFWEMGIFTNHPFDQSVPRTIERSVEELLLEGAKKHDESQRTDL